MKNGYFYGQYEYFMHRKSATNKDVFECESFSEVFEQIIDMVVRHTGDSADYHRIEFNDGIAKVSLTIDRTDANYEGDLAGLTDYMNEILNGDVIANSCNGSYHDHTLVDFCYSPQKAFTQEQMIEKLLEAGLFTEVGNELYTFNPTWFSKE